MAQSTTITASLLQRHAYLQAALQAHAAAVAGNAPHQRRLRLRYVICEQLLHSDVTADLDLWLAESAVTASAAAVLNHADVSGLPVEIDVVPLVRAAATGVQRLPRGVNTRSLLNSLVAILDSSSERRAFVAAFVGAVEAKYGLQHGFKKAPRTPTGRLADTATLLTWLGPNGGGGRAAGVS